MTAKLTEGPWRLFKRDDDPRWFIVAGDYANVGEPDLHVEITTANPADALVMAAAPKLYEALARLLATTDPGNADTHEPGCRCVIHEALAALAEVKGGEA